MFYVYDTLLPSRLCCALIINYAAQLPSCHGYMSVYTDLQVLAIEISERRRKLVSTPALYPEVRPSNFVPDKEYPYWSLTWFGGSLQENFPGGGTSNQDTTTSFYTLSISLVPSFDNMSNWSRLSTICRISSIIRYYAELVSSFDTMPNWSHHSTLCRIGPIIRHYVELVPSFDIISN
jgi:hypothetical protein